MKLKKRILPNSILYGQQRSLLCSVDPRQQQPQRQDAAQEVESSVPADYRFKEMKLNHFGFYDIDFAAFNQCVRCVV